MNIRLLGSFQVTQDNVPLSSALKTEKARALFTYLLIENDRPHRRAKLIDLFWSGFSEKAAYNSLRQSLYYIRSISTDFESVPLELHTTINGVQLLPQAGIWVDIFELNHSFVQCEIHHKQGQVLCDECFNMLIFSIDLYNGDFMDGFSLRDSPQFDWWLLNKRETYHQQVLKALAWVINSLLTKKDYLQAIHFSQREVELSPWCEPAHQRYMKALALAGERGKAVQQFEVCQNILKTDVGIEPSFETIELCEQIRNDALKI